MRYIHWRDDFSITESFSTGQASAPVPQRVRIEYFTAKGHGRFVAERNGNTFVNCELSADGNSLVVHVSLRDRPIGHGRLLRIATVITEDANFPGGLKYSSIPDKVAAVLYFGKSDGPLEMASEIVFDGVDRLSLLEDVRLSRPNIGDLLSWNGSDWVNIPQSDVTPDLSDYVRWTELSDYVTTSQLQEILADLVTSDEITSLSQRITTLEHVQFFELDGNGNVKLKDEYGGLWASGWIATGGVGTGGSGGGGLIETVYTWTELQAMASAPADDVTAAVNARSVYEIWQAVKALQNSTPNVSLVNGSGSSTITVNSVSAEFYTKGQVDNLIGGLVNFHYEFAASTSAVTNPQSNVLYLIGPTGSGADKYEEYVYTDSSWKKIGDTSIDLSNYVQKVSGATNGNFAGLDANGNLTDSGHKHGDYVTALGTNGNYLTWTKNGVANDLTVPFATKATQDGDGNTISSTYLKLSGGTVAGAVDFGSGISGGQDWSINDRGEAAFADLTVNGSQVLTSHQTVTDAAATLTPGTTQTIATIGNESITVQVPHFAMQQDIATLNSYFTNGSANNALKLENHAASYFATAAALSGYVPTSRTINGVDLSANRTFYALGTSLGTSAASGTMLGVSAISYDLSSTGSETSLIKWDTQLGAWHVYGNLFADGWIASGGIGTESGGGGYGVEEITSNQDGTVDFHFTGGDITTIDLNHEHPQYPKYVLCADEAAYNAIANKDSSTLYLIPES